MAKLPFGMLPAHWGTAGKTREIMKAEYELEPGYDLDVKLLSIKKDEFSEDEMARKCIELDKKYNRISESEYHRKLADLIKDEKTKELAILELDYREGKISELTYNKTIATLKGEPWVTVLSMDFGGKGALEGSFELDWNDFFVKNLEKEGYVGPTPDNIVNQWFMEVCKNVALEEFDGTGDFTADAEANLEAVKRWNSDSTSFGEGRTGYQ